ncbi:hypothetical protein HDU85_006748 [Gaertneriomyces sp. JEL0708]|nr:hypothetical protein HDU85_006748 [Gaertneriomyces sp. JEL0708]
MVETEADVGSLKRKAAADPTLEITPPETDNIPVFLRLRPVGDSEKFVTVLNDTEVEVSPSEGRSKIACSEKFSFTHVYDEPTTQQEIFDGVMGDMIEEVFTPGESSGIVFAYGSSGSGKTFTTKGIPEDPGVLLRSIASILKRIGLAHTKKGVRPAKWNDVQIPAAGELAKQPYPASNSPEAQYEYAVYLSFAEIYLEQVYDLQNQTTEQSQRDTGMNFSRRNKDEDDVKRIPCQLREDTMRRKYIASQVEVRIRDLDTARDVIEKVMHNRSVVSTNINAASSRSHLLSVIKVLKIPVIGDGKVDTSRTETSRIAIVDLAGAERLVQAGTEGKASRETKNINKSLHTLAMCVEALRDSQTRSSKRVNVVIPWRDSKLTMLIQPYFETGRASFIINVNPGVDHYRVSSEVFRFASRAGAIQSVVAKKEDTAPPAPKELIEQIEHFRNKVKECETRLIEQEMAIRQECAATTTKRILEMETKHKQRIKAMEKREQTKMDQKLDLAQQAFQDQVASKEQTIHELNATISNLRAQLEGAVDTGSASHSELEQLTQALEAERQAVVELGQRIRDLEAQTAELNSLKARVSDLEDELERKVQAEAEAELTIRGLRESLNAQTKLIQSLHAELDQERANNQSAPPAISPAAEEGQDAFANMDKPLARPRKPRAARASDVTGTKTRGKAAARNKRLSDGAEPLETISEAAADGTHGAENVTDGGPGQARPAEGVAMNISDEMDLDKLMEIPKHVPMDAPKKRGRKTRKSVTEPDADHQERVEHPVAETPAHELDLDAMMEIPSNVDAGIGGQKKAKRVLGKGKKATARMSTDEHSFTGGDVAPSNPRGSEESATVAEPHSSGDPKTLLEGDAIPSSTDMLEGQMAPEPTSEEGMPILDANEISTVTSAPATSHDSDSPHVLLESAECTVQCVEDTVPVDDDLRAEMDVEHETTHNDGEPGVSNGEIDSSTVAATAESLPESPHENLPGAMDVDEPPAAADSTSEETCSMLPSGRDTTLNGSDSLLNTTVDIAEAISQSDVSDVASLNIISTAAETAAVALDPSVHQVDAMTENEEQDQADGVHPMDCDQGSSSAVIAVTPVEDAGMDVTQVPQDHEQSSSVPAVSDEEVVSQGAQDCQEALAEGEHGTNIETQVANGSDGVEEDVLADTGDLRPAESTDCLRPEEQQDQREVSTEKSGDVTHSILQEDAESEQVSAQVEAGDDVSHNAAADCGELEGHVPASAAQESRDNLSVESTSEGMDNDGTSVSENSNVNPPTEGPDSLAPELLQDHIHEEPNDEKEGENAVQPCLPINEPVADELALDITTATPLESFVSEQTEQQSTSDMADTKVDTTELMPGSIDSQQAPADEGSLHPMEGSESREEPRKKARKSVGFVLAEENQDSDNDANTSDHEETKVSATRKGNEQRQTQPLRRSTRRSHVEQAAPVVDLAPGGSHDENVDSADQLGDSSNNLSNPVPKTPKRTNKEVEDDGCHTGVAQTPAATVGKKRGRPPKAPLQELEIDQSSQVQQQPVKRRRAKSGAAGDHGADNDENVNENDGHGSNSDDDDEGKTDHKDAEESAEQTPARPKRKLRNRKALDAEEAFGSESVKSKGRYSSVVARLPKRG